MFTGDLFSFCISYTLMTYFEFSAFSAEFREKEKIGKISETLLFLWAPFVQAVALCTQELLCGGKQLRASCS